MAEPNRGELIARLAESEAEKAALLDVLAIISDGSADLDLILEAVLNRAAALCESDVHSCFLVRDRLVSSVALRAGLTPPTPRGQRLVGDRPLTVAISEARVVQVSGTIEEIRRAYPEGGPLNDRTDQPDTDTR